MHDIRKFINLFESPVTGSNGPDLIYVSILDKSMTFPQCGEEALAVLQRTNPEIILVETFMVERDGGEIVGIVVDSSALPVVKKCIQLAIDAELGAMDSSGYSTDSLAVDDCFTFCQLEEVLADIMSPYHYDEVIHHEANIRAVDPTNTSGLL